MKIQIIAPALVIVALGLCSCNTLQSIRVSSINLLKGTQKKNIEESVPSGEAPKQKNTGTNSKKKTSPKNPNPSPQTNVPVLPEHIPSKEQKEPDKPKIVPPSKPKEKEPTQKEDPKKESILKPKLPAREGLLPPS
ncbi:hypothetical protein OAL09_03790 [Verrucomicrobia bacterium]|jgi:outer membrane biosynthesis protein TonB|nr:hypothetical protein [Verrucomicrobiota bacterium]|tara:strand:+ start:1095 stop:1502 length:408 start_codon:yes stop_codon:yes gene_type:complete